VTLEDLLEYSLEYGRNGVCARYGGRFYYSLDRLGAQIWITLRRALRGLAFDDISMRSNALRAPRNQLAEDLRAGLQRCGLRVHRNAAVKLESSVSRLTAWTGLCLPPSFFRCRREESPACA